MDNEMTMTENVQQPMNTNSKLIGIGERLRAARETMQLSEKDAAARLHLSTKFITIMENEDFEHGLPSTFMRGYLRSYGRMLSLPEKDIENAIADLGMNTPAKSIASPLLQAIPDDNNERYVRWLTYIIIFGLIMLVAMWWNSHSRDVITDTTTKATTPPPTTSSFQQAPANPGTSINTTANPVAPTPPEPPKPQANIQIPNAKPAQQPSAPAAFIQGAQQQLPSTQPNPAQGVQQPVPSNFIQGGPQQETTPSTENTGTSVGKTTLNNQEDETEDDLDSKMAVTEPGLF